MGGLEAHFPKFRPDPLYSRLSIEKLQFEWTNSADATITREEIDKACEAIRSTLGAQKSVLVHCAQGQSRSGTVVVAFMSRTSRMSVEEALRAVQAKRAMAQPNDHFMRCLSAMQLHAAEEVPATETSRSA